MASAGPVGRSPWSNVLRPSRFLSRKNFVAFAIEDPQSDCLGRPLYVCGGDDRRGGVSHLDLFLRQIHGAVVDRPANKLDPEYPRLFRHDPRRRIKLRKGRTRRVKRDAPRRPPGDDQGDPSPIARRLVTIGLTFPTPRLRISLVAKLIHERAGGGSYSLNPFQLPKQPRKHVRPPWSRRQSAARDACLSDGASITQRFARYSANRVEIKLTAAVTEPTDRRGRPPRSLTEFRA
jgi:hypothetical protein